MTENPEYRAATGKMTTQEILALNETMLAGAARIAAIALTEPGMERRTIEDLRDAIAENPGIFVAALYARIQERLEFR